MPKNRILNPKVSPPIPHKTPNPIAFKEANAFDEYICISSGTELASNAPSSGKTSQAKTP
jgi:hypothetical protein